MNQVQCDRCRCAVYYLCSACYELFKGWFYRGARARAEGEG